VVHSAADVTRAEEICNGGDASGPPVLAGQVAESMLTARASDTCVSSRSARDTHPRTLIAALCGYVLGLVPSADAVSRLTTGGTVDLHSAGSGNPGGMNAFRILGRRSGLLVIGADIAKGILACAAGRAVVGDPGAHAAGVGAVLGHCYPIPSRFRGGKGIATSFGQCVATFPAFAPFDAATAILVTRLPGIRRPALASVAVSSSAWLLASVVWWRRGLPNLWGPRPTATLPLANAATIAVIASRALLLLRRQHADRPSESR